MELIYNVNKVSKVRQDWGREETPICCMSAQNVVAFSSTTDLLPGQDGKSGPNVSTTAEHRQFGSTDQEDLSAGPSNIVSCHHVYVCDVDKPWQIYRVTCLADHIIAIEWHLCGYKMLIASEHGLCQVWEMEDHMMNDWKCSQTIDIQEDIITIGWLHQGNRMTFNAEKKENIPYGDKIMRQHFKPSLTHYGKKPVDGWIAVTATGLVCVCLPPSLNKDNAVSIENLLSTRSRIQIANIAHNSNGDILLATSDGNLASVISCYKINLRLEQGICKISVHAKPSLFAKCHLDSSLQDSPAARITHVQFMHKEVGDVLLVAAGNMNNSHIELWHLITDILNLHRVYQNTSDPDSSHCTEKWVYQSSITQSSLPISIATPRFPVVFNSQESNNTVLFQYIALAYHDGSVKLVNKHKFEAMVTTNLDYGIELSEDGEKRRRVVAHITSMQQTFTGCALVGMDQYNCMYFMKVVNTRDPVTQVPVIYLVGMLEYLLYSGYDWWDVLASLKPGVIENVIQKLSDNFAKQTSSIQELLFSRFMAIRGALFRCCSGSQQRAADCHCKLVLHSVSTLFKTVLRPKISSAQEMNPAERLTATCGKNHDMDINKVMKGLNLDKNQAQFVTDVSTLQALQHLIQWVANLTLYLLASLPMAQGYTTFPGSLLLRDASVLGTLRELLLIIKVWGFMNHACLPHFTTTSSDLDILAQIFKLMTRVWLAVKEGVGTGREFDDKLVDDCCLLPSQVLLPPVDQGLFGDTCFQASLFAQPQPVQYNFGEKPLHARKSHTNQGTFPEGQIVSTQKKDIIRQIYLGKNPSEPIRVCSRCDCVSLRKNVAKSPTMMAWELKFTRACLCGGHWKSTS